MTLNEKAATYEISEKQGYADAMLGGLALAHQTAATHGITSGNYEALLDSLWHWIPSEEANRKKVYDDPNKSALEAYAEISNVPRGRNRNEPDEIKRILKKQQIITDCLYEMDMLFRRPKVYKTKHEDDNISWS